MLIINDHSLRGFHSVELTLEKLSQNSEILGKFRLSLHSYFPGNAGGQVYITFLIDEESAELITSFLQDGLNKES